MMKAFRGLLIFFVTILLLLAAISPSLAQDDLSAVIAKIQPSVVLILTYDADGKIHSQASGFFVGDNGEVITSRHVLLGISRADIKTQSGKLYTITDVVAEDKEGDLIRVSTAIPPAEARPLAICPTVPKVGERVIVLGNPLGLEQTAADGIVSAVRDIPAFGNIIQITAPISPGSSGSPVVNINGEVIAVATFQFIEGQNLNFSIPAERIAKLAHGNQQTLAEWGTGIRGEWAESAEGLYILGLLFLFDKDYEKALYYFKKAIEENPDYAKAHCNLGVTYGELGRHNDAIESLKQAIRINPDLAEAHLNLGVAYGNLGLYYEEIEEYKQAIGIDPDFAEAHYNLGVANDKLGRYYEAIEAYKQAIRINPDYAEAHYNLGLTYSNLGRYNDSIEAFKQAIYINPDDANAHYNLGRSYILLGRYNEGIEATKEAVRIDPDYAIAHYNLGLAYLIIGETSSALDEYKILKELDKELANKLFNLIYP